MTAALARDESSLVVVQAAPADARIEIELVDGKRLRVPSAFDTDALRRIVATLEGGADPAHVQIIVCAEPVDMRYGFDRLAQKVRELGGEWTRRAAAQPACRGGRAVISATSRWWRGGGATLRRRRPPARRSSAWGPRPGASPALAGPRGAAARRTVECRAARGQPYTARGRSGAGAGRADSACGAGGTGGTAGTAGTAGTGGSDAGPGGSAGVGGTAGSAGADAGPGCYRSPWTPDVAPLSFTQREAFGGAGRAMSIAGFSPGSVAVG